MRRHLTALLVAGLLLGACGDDDDDDGQSAITSIPDEPTSSTSSTTTEPPTVAPDVIPQDVSQITEEYVEGVLNALYEVSNEALRAAMKSELVEDDSIALVEATSSARTVAEDINALLDLSLNGFQGFRSDPEPLTAEVLAVLNATPTCVLAEIAIDRSGPLVDPPSTDPATRHFVRLTPATPEQRESGLNPTAWVTDGLPTSSNGSTPSEGCP